MSEAEIIRNAYARAGSPSDLAISEVTGMNYDRLHKRRLAPGRIGALDLSELRLLLRHADFTDQEILGIVKGEQ